MVFDGGHEDQDGEIEMDFDKGDEMKESTSLQEKQEKGSADKS